MREYKDEEIKWNILLSINTNNDNNNNSVNISGRNNPQ